MEPTDEFYREIGKMEADVITLKSDISDVKQDLKVIRAELADVKKSIESSATAFNVGVKFILGVGTVIGFALSFGYDIIKDVFWK